MTVRAVKTIEKDEEILASYYDANVSVQSAAERFFLSNSVAAQVRSRWHINTAVGMAFFIEYSAGGLGFDSRLRHNILRCSMQRM
jgi:hypothetical protein